MVNWKENILHRKTVGAHPIQIALIFFLLMQLTMRSITVRFWNTTCFEKEAATLSAEPTHHFAGQCSAASSASCG